MLLLCKNQKNQVILDIGANLGISILGFRKLGFKNTIYAFEPNFYLYQKFLKKLKKIIKILLLKILLWAIQIHLKYFLCLIINQSVYITFVVLIKNI